MKPVVLIAGLLVGGLLLGFGLRRCNANQSNSQQREAVEQQLAEQQPVELFLRAFKQEAELEVWIKARGERTFQHFTTYAICASSGVLGPKRREGDRQVPEGVYYIDRFNPNSSYHLSLGLNYPNASDRQRGDQTAPGSDIFIHGKCVTIGCLPLTDRWIEELYALAEMAKSGGQKQIPVHLFPARMDTPAFVQLAATSVHAAFWEELRPIYQYFEANRQLPPVRITAEGAYVVE